jgi:16S rRNA (uracil1498-N3)-methyltransferase
MSKRFIANTSDIIFKTEDKVILQGEVYKHLKALRKEVKDVVQVNEYVLEIEEIHKEYILANITEVVNVSDNIKSCVTINVYQGYLKADKMEYLVQKSVELGADNITGILTQNTVVKLDEKDRLKKQERLQKIAIAAVEQCGRESMPHVNKIVDIKDVRLDEDIVLLCHEKSEVLLKTVINNIQDNVKSIAVLIGPEGGFSDRDIEYIKQKNKNVLDISLGKRILRAETACVYILSILGYEFGI